MRQNFQTTNTDPHRRMTIQQLQNDHPPPRINMLPTQMHSFNQNSTFKKVLKRTDLGGEPIQWIHSQAKTEQAKDVTRSGVSIVDRFFKSDVTDKNRNQFQVSIFDNQSARQQEILQTQLHLRTKQQELLFYKQMLENIKGVREEEHIKHMQVQDKLRDRTTQIEILKNEHHIKTTQLLNTIDNLRTQLETQIQSHRAEIEQRISSWKGLQNAHQAIKARAAQLEQKVKQRDRKISKLEKTVNQQKFQNQVSKNLSEKLKKEVERINEQLLEYQFTHKERTQQLLVKRPKESTNNQKAITRLIEKLESKANSIAFVTKMNQHLEQKNEKLEKKYLEEVAASDYMQQRTSQIVQKYKALQVKYQQLQQRYSMDINNRESYRNSELERQISQKNVMISQLNQKITMVEHEYKQRQKEYELKLLETSRTNEAYEHQKDKKLVSLERLNTELKINLENAIQDIKNIRFEHQREKLKLKEEYQADCNKLSMAHSRELKEANTKIIDIERQLAHCRTLSIKLEDQELLKKQIHTKNKQIDRLNEKFMEQQKQLKMSQTKLENIEQDLKYFQQYTEQNQMDAKNKMVFLEKNEEVYSHYEAELRQIIYDELQQDYEDRENIFESIVKILSNKQDLQIRHKTEMHEYIKQVEDSRSYIVELQIQCSRIRFENGQLVNYIQNLKRTIEEFQQTNAYQSELLEKSAGQIQEYISKIRELERKLESEMQNKSWIQQTLNNSSGKSRIQRIHNERAQLFQKINQIISSNK